jgi:dTDP-4-amino-4,6-dideoxygalactose transaminase
MEVINAIATNRNLLVIEDAAQAHGAIANSNSKFQIPNPKAGNLSDAAAFSFYLEKSGALGDGGAITTNDSELAKVASALETMDQKQNITMIMRSKL